MGDNCERCQGLVDSEGACVSCGFQREDTKFVWNATFAEGGQVCGQAVGEVGNNLGNSGKNSARYKGLSNDATAGSSNARAEAVLRHIYSQLNCSADVRSEAEAFMAKARPILSGSGRMPLDKLAAACLYLAIRKHNEAVSLEELSKKAQRTRFEVGAALQEVLGALNMDLPDAAFFSAPPVDYLRSLKRHMPHLEPLVKSKKQAAVEFTFAELMHWVKNSDRVHSAAPTPVLAASILILALQAHQVKVKSADVLKAFELSSKASVCRRLSEIKTMLADTARLLPWLSKVDAKHIVQHVSTIVKVPMQTKQVGPSPSRGTSQNTTQNSKPSRKRRMAARDAEAEAAADGSSDLSSSSQMPKRRKPAAEAETNESFDDAIGDDELGQYMVDRHDEAERLLAWQAHQDAM